MSRSSKIGLVGIALALQACNQGSTDFASANDVAAETGANSAAAMTPDQPSTTSGQAYAGGGLVLPTYQASELSAAGRLFGSLARSGDCLFIKVGTAGEGFIPLFPHGRTEWDPARDILTLNGRNYRIGDKIDFGGGSAGPDPNELKLTSRLPQECPRMNYWMVSLTS